MFTYLLRAVGLCHVARDPIDHPDIAAMSSRDLADLPLIPPPRRAGDGQLQCHRAGRQKMGLTPDCATD